MDRRTFLLALSGSAFVLASGALLAGCGGGGKNESSSPSTNTPAISVNANGPVVDTSNGQPVTQLLLARNIGGGSAVFYGVKDGNQLPSRITQAVVWNDSSKTARILCDIQGRVTQTINQATGDFVTFQHLSDTQLVLRVYNSARQALGESLITAVGTYFTSAPVPTNLAKSQGSVGPTNIRQQNKLTPRDTVGGNFVSNLVATFTQPAVLQLLTLRDSDYNFATTSALVLYAIGGFNPASATAGLVTFALIGLTALLLHNVIPALGEVVTDIENGVPLPDFFPSANAADALPKQYHYDPTTGTFVPDVDTSSSSNSSSSSSSSF